MRIDVFLMGAAIGGFFYLWGYRGLALGIWAISALLLFSDIRLPAKSGSKTKGYTMGSPIIIESTRNAPFRVPGTQSLFLKPDGKVGEGAALGWFGKSGFKIFGGPGKELGKRVKKAFEDE